MKRSRLVVTLVASAVLGAVTLPAMAAGGGTRYAVFLVPGSNWDYGHGFATQSGVAKHKKYWKNKKKGGKVVVGGYFAKTDQAMFMGAKGATRAELKKLASGDPMVRKRILKFEIREWKLYFDLKVPKASTLYDDYDPADYVDSVPDESE